ncbi:protein GAST1-like isoform X2 [Phragmites australis]|uniref:protein GAST1-like isoform X2 n=1 Tax=Phragmites australis TaxID=29695 RepID=UPI002D7A1755|nr:protein GAST1-like isoform X2 [Phragmites australis]
MESRGMLLLCCCVAMVVLVLLSGECQANYYYVTSPGPTPPPTSSSAVPPAMPTTFPMYGVTPGSLKPRECGGRCAARCSATAYRKPCLCVPAGTYGNKESCPCYSNWKTKRGGPKCP